MALACRANQLPARIYGRQAFGLAEIISPTTKPQVVPIFAPHAYEVLAGVFTSNDKTILNVVNQTRRRIYQYRLPLTSTSKPVNTLGPTFLNNDPVNLGITGSSTKPKPDW